MRPGQLTPENLGYKQRWLGLHFCFNEAGAINPGKPNTITDPSTGIVSFNEAGAINPGKHVIASRAFKEHR